MSIGTIKYIFANLALSISSIYLRLYFDVDHKQRLQHADWAPVNNTLLYVKSNDIYIVKNIRRQMNPIQVTSSGVPGEVYNGVADWTYEGNFFLKNQRKQSILFACHNYRSQYFLKKEKENPFIYLN